MIKKHENMAHAFFVLKKKSEKGRKENFKKELTYTNLLDTMAK
jgi:hypothetical protein